VTTLQLDPFKDAAAAVNDPFCCIKVRVEKESEIEERGI